MMKARLYRTVFRSSSEQLTGSKEKGEVFQSDEGTAKDPLSIIVLDEGDIHAWHRHIAEDEEESYGGQTHEDQRLILPEHSANLRFLTDDAQQRLPDWS